MLPGVNWKWKVDVCCPMFNTSVVFPHIGKMNGFKLLCLVCTDEFFAKQKGVNRPSTSRKALLQSNPAMQLLAFADCVSITSLLLEGGFSTDLMRLNRHLNIARQNHQVETAL